MQLTYLKRKYIDVRKLNANLDSPILTIFVGVVVKGFEYVIWTVVLIDPVPGLYENDPNLLF